jgi:hypothetical protein
MSLVRRDGRVVECTGLENRHGFIAHLGFKSLSLRHIQEKRLLERVAFFRLKLLNPRVPIVSYQSV